MTPRDTSEHAEHPRARELQTLYEQVLDSYEHRRQDLPDLVDKAVALASEVGAKDILAMSLIRRIEHFNFRGDINKSLQDIETVGKLLEQNEIDKHKVLRIRAHWYDVQAHHAFAQGNFTECRDLELKALEYAQIVGDNLLLVQIYVHLGVGLTAVPDPVNCLASWKKALDIFPYDLLQHAEPLHQLAAKRAYMSLYSALGFASFRSGNYESAHAYFKGAIAADSADIWNNCWNYIYLSEILIEKGDFQEALDAANHAIELANNTGIVNLFLRDALSAKAKAHFKLNDFSATIESCEMALSLAVLPGANTNFALYSWLALSWAHLTSSDPNGTTNAMEYLSKAEQALPDAPDYIKNSNIEWIAEAKFLLGDTKDAYEALRIALRGRDTFYTHKFHNEIGSMQMQVQAEREERMKEIEQMKRKEVEKELSNSTLQLIAQTELLEELRASLSATLRKLPPGNEVAKELREKLRNLPCKSVDWDRFDTQFKAAHPEFTQKLAGGHPDLSTTELRICSLVRMNLKSEEIARLFCLSPRTIENHRYHIRTKMHLAEGADLMKELMKL